MDYKYKEYDGIYNIELNYLIPCLVRIENIFKRKNELNDVIDKTIIKKFIYNNAFIKLFTKRSKIQMYKKNKKIINRKKDSIKKCLNELKNFHIDNKVVKLFSKIKISTIVTKVNKNLDIYEYTDGYNSLILEDRFFILNKTNEFTREIKFKFKEGNNEIDLGTFKFMSIRLMCGDLRYVYFGNIDLVKFLYVKMFPEFDYYLRNL